MARRWVVAGLVLGAALLALLLLREDAPPAGGARQLVAQRSTPAVPEFDLPQDAAASGEAEPDVQAVQPLALDGEAPATDATLVLRHADGVPARGCMVAVVAGEKVAWSALTDEEGAARGAALTGAVTVWVGGATLVPAAFLLADMEGRHELMLPPGEIIDGWVVINGGPPTEPVPLGLESDEDAAEGVPWFVRDALSPRRPGTPHTIEMGALTGADGAFRFSGLPAGWAGRFVPDTEYWTLDPHGLDARAPEHGRVVTLQRVARIRFRVVSADERAPVPFAEGMVIVHSAVNSTSYSLRCDEQGRGDIPMLRWETSRRVQLDLADPAGSSRVHVSFDVDDPAHDLDLGDIELTPRWSIPFRVTEPDGTPIAGALGGTECESSLSVRTDAAGLARLQGVPPGCAELRVGAARHEPVRVPLPPQPPSDPIAVTLMPCAWLELSVTTDDGERRPGLQLSLRTERHVTVADATSSFHESALQLDVSVVGAGVQYGRDLTSWPDGSALQKRRFFWRLRQLGDFALGCMEPGAPVSLAISDCSEHVVWSEELRLEAGEQRHAAAVIGARPQPLDVLVTDPMGAPLQDASVVLRATSLAAASVSASADREETDAAGHVLFENVYAPAVDVTCEKEGYVPATLAAVAPGMPAHVILSRGLTVTLHCTDPQGRPALVDGAWIGGPPKRAGDRVDAIVDEDGLLASCATWRFVGLQPGAQTIAVSAGGRHFTLEHDAGVPDAALIVPDFGALVVSGLQSAKGQASSTLRVRLEGSDADTFSESLHLGHLARDQVSWPLVFPGRYVVELRDGDRVLAGPAFVEVRAGEESLIELP